MPNERDKPETTTDAGGRLERLVSELHHNEGTDFEGDRTYRVHIKTAERLLMAAYKAGLEDARWGK